jgi:hypothetical protein
MLTKSGSILGTVVPPRVPLTRSAPFWMLPSNLGSAAPSRPRDSWSLSNQIFRAKPVNGDVTRPAMASLARHP